VTPKELAKMAGCGVRHVRHHIVNTGRIKAEKEAIGYRWNIDERSAAEFVLWYNRDRDGNTNSTHKEK